METNKIKFYISCPDLIPLMIDFCRNYPDRSACMVRSHKIIRQIFF